MAPDAQPLSRCAVTAAVSAATGATDVIASAVIGVALSPPA